MSTLHLSQTTTITPEQYVAGLTDFGPGRNQVFSNSADEDLVVHDLKPTSADVTEGSGGVWERLSYDWSNPNRVVLKTTDSAFSGFPRDTFTTLPDTEDRIMATAITASWRYRDGTTAFAARDAIRSALLASFAAHKSRSVQHTLHAMGEAALAACPDATEITLAMPNRHHLLVDLSPFGLDNPNEIFVATDQPFGLIEATVKRAIV